MESLISSKNQYQVSLQAYFKLTESGFDVKTQESKFGAAALTHTQKNSQFVEEPKRGGLTDNL